MLALTLWPGTAGVGVPVSIADEIEAAGRLEELQRTCVRLQRQLASAKNGREDMIDAVFRAARDAALVVGRSVPVSVPPKDKRRKGIEAGLLHLTDWQLGKETESYSSDICEERVGRAVAIASKLAAIQREDHPVPCCHVMLGVTWWRMWLLFRYKLLRLTLRCLSRSSGLLRLCSVVCLRC